MTNQREMILKELQSSKEHLSADELYERIKKRMPRISLATVYRNLEVLSEAGIVAKLEVGGRQKRFDYDVERHDHIYCVNCNRVDNLLLEQKPINYTSLLHSDGYTITGCRLEVSGLCPDCQEKQNNKGRKKMGCGTKGCGPKPLTEEQKNVLTAMAKCDGPCGSKDIAAATGLEPKQVSCRITALKKKGYVESPVRCKYSITDEGKKAVEA